MKSLLVQIDGKMPNLALMKLSAYHKKKGDIVGFNIANPDVVYISVIFKKNYPQAQGVVNWYPNSDCFIGGPGLDKPNSLKMISSEIDNIMPDYSLYEIDYSMGFTSRGCIRKCGFCIVPRLEGSIRTETPIELFHHPEHKKIMLLDNNLLASKTWKRTLEYIIEKDLRVNYSQGLDIRLVNREVAEYLAETKAETRNFARPMYHFAWDFIETEKSVINGIKILKESGIKERNLTFYILTGYNTTHEQDLYRVKTLIELGVNPYVMVYNNDHSDRFIHHLSRWVDGRFYTVCDFVDYRYLSLSIKEEIKNFSKSKEE